MQPGSEIGRAQIHDDVLAALAALAVLGTYGIVGMANYGVADSWAELLHQNTGFRGIKIAHEFQGVRVDAYVTVAYGMKIHDVADRAAANVRRALFQHAGTEPAKIVIHVTGIRTEGARDILNRE